MSADRKILVVYNTCGINRDNTEWYKNCINSFLQQEFDGFRVVLSSCLNSSECIKDIYSTFGNKISYNLISDAVTVNVSFNDTVRRCVSEFGEFESYLYVDSGCTFDDQKDILESAYSSLQKENTSIVTVQADTDEGLDQLGHPYVYESRDIQVKDEDLVMPVGKGINLHVALFGNDIFKVYGKVLPDVFAAFCTESTFSFLSASLCSRWVIMADKKIRHLKAVDGPVASRPHRKAAPDKSGEIVENNCWNNLMCGRNALDFIEDPEAYAAGLGYEEHQEIMVHNKESYTEGIPNNPSKLVSTIKKYLFLSDKELDHSSIKTIFLS